MRKDNPLADRLLREEGLIPGQLTETERKELRAMLELRWKRANRAKRAAIISWILVAATYLGAGVINASHPQAASVQNIAGSALIGALPVFLTIAIFLTISYFVRYRGASMTEIRVRLAEIESRLSQQSSEKK